MITVSIISHGQLAIAKDLIKEITNDNRCRLILTLNIPEDESFLKDIESNNLQIIRNSSILGFSKNHNNAFKYCKTDFFLVLNPDVILKSKVIFSIYDFMKSNNTAVAAPISLSKENNIINNARSFPHLWTPFLRLFINNFGINNLYYKENTANQVDWISGMFMLIQSNLYKALNGFDERFFLYYEDVDFCKRVNKIGEKVYINSEYSVIHEGNRQSRKSLKFFLHHISSFIKYHWKHGI